jgi:hypothetical protein
MMRTRRTFIAGLAIAAIFTGSGAVVTPPAHAAYWDWCPHGQFCIAEHPNGYGRHIVTNLNANDLTNPAWNFNDVASSVWNRSPHKVVIYEHVRCDNRFVWHRFQPYGGQTNLVGWYLDERVSSWCHDLG